MINLFKQNGHFYIGTVIIQSKCQCKKQIIQQLFQFIKPKDYYSSQRLNFILILMNIEHIKIPFDELDLHKHQDKNQIFLKQTLLYSTKVNLHFAKNKFLCLLAITKYHIWFKNEKNQSHIFSLPFQSLLCLLKCMNHPEIVFMTDNNFDNIRVSTSTQMRCNGIISSVSYVFTRIFKIPKELSVHYINSADLSYFQRRIEEKLKCGQLNLSRYKQVKCKYQQKFSGIGNIFGQQFIQKIVLVKQIYSQHDHMIHIAHVNQKQYYYLHTVSKDQRKIQLLRNHQLVYARALQYKIQLFFQYVPQLPLERVLLSDLFQQLWILYDEIEYRNKDAVLNFSLLCFDQDIKKIKLRQSRYDFLLVQNDLKRLIYQCYYIYNQKKQPKLQKCKRCLQLKLYHLCLLLYEYAFGKALYFHQDPQMILQLKQSQKVTFPVYLTIKIDKQIKRFLKKGIQFEYTRPQELLQVENESWLKKNNISIKM